jgi:probable dihydroxyacetone kinase regulator
MAIKGASHPDIEEDIDARIEIENAGDGAGGKSLTDAANDQKIGGFADLTFQNHQAGPFPILEEAFGEKPLDKITVTDIVNDCGVNRQTFYYHFQDLADLVEWTCLEDADKALQDRKTYTTWQEGFLSIFALMQSDKVFIMNIYHSVSLDQLELYLYKLTYPLLLNVVNEQAKGMEVREEDKAFIANFYKYSFVGLVLEWIKRDMVDRAPKPSSTASRF